MQLSYYKARVLSFIRHQMPIPIFVWYIILGWGTLVALVCFLFAYVSLYQSDAGAVSATPAVHKNIVDRALLKEVLE